MSFILTTQNLTKAYHKKYAAKDINLHLKEGEIYGLIGRNGAGKTTVMRMIGGLAHPTSGDYTLHGAAKSDVGVLIENPGIYPKMTAEENLRLKCIAKGCDKKSYIDDLLRIVGLCDTEKKKAGAFSLGMRQRLGIALALVGDPKLLILDEPINGLDPQGIVEIRQTLERLKEEKGITIMISSHILDELSKLADSYGIINEGTLVDEFAADDLMERCGTYVRIRTDDNERAASLLITAGYSEIIVDNGGCLRIENAVQETAAINKALVENGIGVSELMITNLSLEDYYLNVTGGIYHD